MKIQARAHACTASELALFTAYFNTGHRLTPGQKQLAANLCVTIEIVPHAVRAHFEVTGAPRQQQAILSRSLQEHASLNEAMEALAAGVMKRVLEHVGAGPGQA